jgi:HSP20 family protein
MYWSAWDRGFGDLRDMDRWFRALESTLDSAGSGRAEARGPEFRWTRSGEAFELSVDVPGMKQDDLELSVTAQEVTLKGRRAVDVDEGWTPRHQERRAFQFERTFQSSARIDAERVSARLENGVLRVTLPFQPAELPKAIPVQIA